jgi:pimeloyl-ACP methyl ester carboxylesterase
MQVQGDDAGQLLAALADGPAYVLGCSGGALTGLDLAARHPEQVGTLVAHEPPAFNVLPDSAGWRAAFQQVHETYRSEGAGPAMQQFIAAAVRAGGPPPADGEPGPPSQEQVPTMPDMAQMPPEMAEGMVRMQANSQFFLAHLLPATIGHVPDIVALRAASPRIVVGAGDASAGQMPHLAALALADRLGITPMSFLGDHQGFATPSRAVRRHGPQGPPRELTALSSSCSTNRSGEMPAPAGPAKVLPGRLVPGVVGDHSGQHHRQRGTAELVGQLHAPGPLGVRLAAAFRDVWRFRA